MSRKLELSLESGQTVKELRDRLFDLPNNMRLTDARDYEKLTFEDDK